MSEKQISLYVEKNDLSEIDRYAKRCGISRQKLMSNILKAGLDDLAMLEKLGVIRLYLMGKGFREALPKITGPDQETLFPMS